MIRTTVPPRARQGRVGPIGLGLPSLGALVLWVTVANAACGDGVVDVGEDCDAGADPSGTCCTSLCTVGLPGTACRPAEGVCDLEEACDGLSDRCPTNAFRPAEVCRPAAGACDLPETCSGMGPACPADSLQLAGVECRPAATPCDVPEACTGTALDCPVDTGEPDGDLDGICDPLDVCPLAADPTQVDGDGDGVGDACDPCSNQSNTELEDPRLALSRLSAPGGDDRLRLKAGLTIPDAPTVDPVRKGFRLVLSGPLGVVFDAFIPPGSFDPSARVGWRVDGPGRWSYKNGGREVPRIHGISSILLRQDRVLTRKLRLVVSGRGGDLRAAVGQPSLTMTVVIDAPLAMGGQCGESRFVTVGADSSCRLLNGAHRLECRQRE